MINVGKMIATIRTQRGLSQQQLADKMNLSKQAISNYERGVREPDYVTLEALADVLNVPMGMLITKDDQEAALGEIYATYPEKQPEPDGPWTLRQEEREDPDRKALFLLSKYGSAKDIRQVNALIDALKATNPDFYGGDDPA
jgi:transcriptional regulator with XRE-family HTH domain